LPEPFLTILPPPTPVMAEEKDCPVGSLMVNCLAPRTKLPAVPEMDLTVWSKPLRFKLAPAARSLTMQVLGMTPAAPQRTVVEPVMSRFPFQSLPVLDTVIFPVLRVSLPPKVP